MRSCREMGLRTVAVFSEVDRTSRHVMYADEAYCIGPAESHESYLNIEKIIAVAKHCKADAIHPGYGFLSENADFVRRCDAEGIIFIGPTAETMEEMGDKIAARKRMMAAGVPVVPGTTEPLGSADEALRICREIGYPVMLKASMGGGGKGMRLIHSDDEVKEAYDAARSESLSSFGDDTVYLEKFVEEPHHIEFQILGDSYGNVVHLFDRECSVQRRNQKIVEESPSPFLTPELRREMGAKAGAAAKAAAWMLLSGSKKESIRLLTPKGMELTLAVEDICLSPDCVRCAIRKDSGDDPDITRDTLIYAEVRKTETVGIVIDGGQGVGRVTKPGLDQPVGAAAINSVPRLMIREAVEEVCGLFGYTGGMYVVISAPDGETLAKKTFNPRLGIEGGISILGTTGIVEPMSEQALVDTIHVELRQRREGGADYVLLAPGNYGVDYIKGAMGIDPATAVMTSNFIGDALEMCRELDFRGVLLIGHIGKLVKLAGGMWNTHSRYGDCRMDILTACAAAEGLHGGAAAEMLCCATCDDALRLLKEQGLYDAVLHRLAGRIDDMMHYKCSDIETGAILFSKEYGYLCETKGASKLLRRIKEE